MWPNSHDGELLFNPNTPDGSLANKEKIRRRPRNKKSTEAILVASIEVPVSRSYAGLKIDADAAAAGAGKATIYDWCPTKAKRAIDAFFHRTGPDL